MRIAVAALASRITDLPTSDKRGTLAGIAPALGNAHVEPRAFRQIFDQHAPAVRRFLRDLLRDAVAADEALQETFVRAHVRRKLSTKLRHVV